MTYTCIAKKGVHKKMVCGLNEIAKNKYIELAKFEGFEVEVLQEIKSGLYTKKQVKEMILDFYNEFSLTTIEIGEKEVDNWMERRNGNG